MKPLFFLLSLVLLSGCASSLTTGDAARMKRIGVVSLMGDSINASYISLTAFTNQHYDEPVSGLGIDDLAEQEGARLLGVQGVPLPAERGVGRSTRVFGTRSLDIDPARIVATAQRQQLDTLVVIHPAIYHGTPANIEGVTLMGAFAYRDQVRPVLFASVSMYDGRDGRRLGFAAARTREDSEAAMANGLPVVWKKKYSAYSPEDREVLREAIRNQFREALRSAFVRMDLLAR